MTTPRKKVGVATVAGISMSLVIAASMKPGMAAVRATSAADSCSNRSKSSVRKSSTYTDGVYTATGQYGGLPSSITVTVRLASDTICTVQVTPNATDPTSLALQRRFAAAVPTVVVGRPIDEVQVGRLAGSSGTPNGFNAAIRRIREQAKTGGATRPRADQ